MKVLYVITSGALGGAQRYLSQIANDQVGRGADVVVACGGSCDWLEQNIRTPITHVSLKRTWNPLSFFVYRRSLKRLLKQGRPDVVHFHSSHTFAGISVAKKAGVKTVATVHGLSFFHESGLKGVFYRLFLRFFLRNVDHIVCVCKSDREILKKFLGFSDDRFSVIYPGLGKQSFLSKTEARKHLGLPESGFVIGTLGRFDYHKNQRLLLDVFARFKDRNTILCLIGYGSLKTDLEQYASDLGLKERVVFASGSAEHLKAFDVFVLTSRLEGFPYVLLEAGEACIPIVSTDVGGIRELITSEDSGVLIDDFDPQNFVDAIQKAIDFSKRFTEGLRNSIHGSFLDTNLVDSHNELYNVLLKKDS